MAIFKKKSSKSPVDQPLRSPTSSPPVQQPSMQAMAGRNVSDSYVGPNAAAGGPNARRMTNTVQQFAPPAAPGAGDASSGRNSPSGYQPQLGLGLPSAMQQQQPQQQQQQGNASSPLSGPPVNAPAGGVAPGVQPGAPAPAAAPGGVGVGPNPGPNGVPQMAGVPGPNGSAVAAQQPKANTPSYPWSTRPLRLHQPPPTNPPTQPMSPFPRYGLSVPAHPSHSGHLLLFGGLSNERAHNDLWSLEIRDCALQMVKTRGEPPLPRIGHVSAIADRVMLVFGGDTKVHEHDRQDDGLYVLDLRTQEWSRLAVSNGPCGRYGHAACMIGSNLYVHGGHTDGRNLDDLWCFNVEQLAKEGVEPQWERVTYSSPAPLARTGHTIVPYQNKLYLFGGTDGDYHYNDSWSFDIATGTWKELECIGYIPIPRESHAAAIVDDVIYVFGGRDVHGKDLGDLAAFRISNQRWYMFQNMGPSPMAKSGHSLCAAANKIFVVGGESNLAPTFRDDPNVIHVLDTAKIKYPVDAARPGTAPTRPRTASDAGAPQTGPYRGANSGQFTRSHDNLGRSMSPSAPQEMPPRSLGVVSEGVQAPGFNPFATHQPRSESQDTSNRPGSRGNNVPPLRPRREGDEEYRARALSPTAATNPNSGPAVLAGMMNGLPGGPVIMGPNGAAAQGPNGTAVPSGPGMPNGVTPPASNSEHHVSRSVDNNHSASRSIDGSITGSIPGSPQAHVPSHTIHPNVRNTRSPPPQLLIPDGLQRPALPPDAFYFGGRSTTGSRPNSLLVTGRPGSLLGRPSSIVGRPTSMAGTADLLRELKARENEADNAKRRETALRVILSRAVQQGFIAEDDENLDLPPSGEIDGETDTVRQLADALIQMKQDKANLQNEVANQMKVASDRIQEAERLQKAAVQETAFYRAKSAALEAGSAADLTRLERERITDLEHQLEATTLEQEQNERQIQQLRAEVEHVKEQNTFDADREADATKRAEEAETAHAGLLAELEDLRTKHAAGERAVREHTERFITMNSTVQQREAERDQFKSQLDDSMFKREEHLKLIEQVQAALLVAGTRATELEAAHTQSREHATELETQLAELRHQLETKTRENESTEARLAELEGMHARQIEETNSLRGITAGHLGELLESHRSLSANDERSIKGHSEQLRALEEEKSSLLKLLREAGQRVDATELAASSNQQKAREMETAHQNLRAEMRQHRSKFATSQTELSKYRDLCSSKDSELRERDQAVTELQTRVSLLRRLLAEQGVEVTDTELANAEVPSAEHLETQLREKSRAHETAQREIDELQRRCHEAEGKVESLGRLVERIKDTRSPSAASMRSPSPQNGSTGDSDRRAIELERRLQEAEAQHREKMAALESDYQTAVRYVKGTEKMLKRMKDELNKQKATNSTLSSELDSMRGRSASVEPGATRALVSGRTTPSDNEMGRRLQTLQSQYSTLQNELQAAQDTLSARNREFDLLRMRCEEADRENEGLRDDLAQSQQRITTLLEMKQAGIHFSSDDEDERLALRRSSQSSDGASAAFDKFTKELNQWERSRSPDALGLGMGLGNMGHHADQSHELTDHDLPVHDLQDLRDLHDDHLTNGHAGPGVASTAPLKSGLPASILPGDHSRESSAYSNDWGK